MVHDRASRRRRCVWTSILIHAIATTRGRDSTGTAAAAVPSTPRDRDHDRDDPRDVFMRDLDLPGGLEREIVRDRDREYTFCGSETRTLSILGAFRVVCARDLRGHDDRPLDPRDGDLQHLREQGLVRTVPMARGPAHRARCRCDRSGERR